MGPLAIAVKYSYYYKKRLRLIAILIKYQYQQNKHKNSICFLVSHNKISILFSSSILQLNVGERHSTNVLLML